MESPGWYRAPRPVPCEVGPAGTHSSMSRTSYPITAFSLVNGLGRSTDEVARALREGRDGFGPAPIELPFEACVGVVPGELSPTGLPFRSRHMEVTFTAYAEIEAKVRAAVDRWGRARVGMILSTSTGGIGQTEVAYLQWRTERILPDGYDFVQQHAFHSFADSICERSGIRGPRYIVSTACSSSGKVFSSARRLIEAGLLDAVVIGGTDVPCLTTLRGFHSLGVLSPEPCRPFGAARPGMNIGEGCALLLLEREGEPLGMLLGVGESSDAFHMSAPHPEGLGAFAAMKAALDDAGLSANTIDYVNAHGTGTIANDGAEAKAIERLLGDEVPVVATKAYTGHTLGACGATEAIFCLMAIRDGFLPASLRCDPRDPDVHIRVLSEPLSSPVHFALSNSFAFGGSNVAVLLGAPR